MTALLLTFLLFRKNLVRKANISMRDAFIIGLAQAVAVLPGLSRSGSTIATGLLLGNSKEKLAQFSFIMVIPPILGEALLDVVKMLNSSDDSMLQSVAPLSLIVGFLAAFISGCVACKWMISIVKTRQTDIFRHLLRPGRRRNIDFQLHLTEKRCCIP